MKTTVLSVIVSVLLGGSLMAKDSKNQALNWCALATIIGNEYVFNYEYLHNDAHGFVARVEYVPLSNTDVTADRMTYVLNYRYHFSKSMESFFVGVFGKYRVMNGTGTDGTTSFNFEVPEWSGGINIGYRWVWENGFNIVFSLGEGLITTDQSITPTSASIASVFNTFKSEKSAYFGSSFLGEFSIGYTF